jgi:hypothetical protein
MSTANVRVNRALNLLGATSPIKKARPEVINLAFEVLVEMLNLWTAQNIALGLTIPTVIGDDIEEPSETVLAIDFNLAVTVAPYLFKDPTPAVINKARQTMQAMRTEFVALPATLYPNTLPLGSGNTGPASGQTPIGRKFYPEPATLDTESGVPLII